jgi:hypothetical protein
MIIINKQTPTSTITAIKVGDMISNGLGTFGEVEEIKFEDTNEHWHFIFSLVGGGYVEAKIERKSC